MKYFQVVTSPMDLTTVKARLDNNFYSELGPCVQDIQQVWTNAKLYNPATHTIHKWAEELNMITKGWVAKCQQSLNTSPTKTSPVKPSSSSSAPASAPSQQPRPSSTAAAKIPEVKHNPGENQQLNLRNLSQCADILEVVMSDKMRHCAEPFLNITTRYSSEAYTPMDLNQIKHNLDSGVYRTATEFATDFRRMISETYRFCIDKDPLIEQAQQLQHHFEIDFAKRIQFTQDDFIVEDDLDLLDDDTLILKKILAIGKEMEMTLDKMIQKELAVLEENRFHDAQMLVKEIETVPAEVMEDVIKIMQANKEDLQVEADGTVEVSYNDLSSKTISDIRKLLHSKNLLSSQRTNLKSDVKEENISMDVG